MPLFSFTIIMLVRIIIELTFAMVHITVANNLRTGLWEKKNARTCVTRCSLMVTKEGKQGQEKKNIEMV